MADIYGETIKNIWLRSLRPADRALLSPHLSQTSMRLGEVLTASGQTNERIYFPEGGLASVVLDLHDTGTTEVGLFGIDGMSSVASRLGGEVPLTRTFVQIDGSTALRMDLAQFRAAMMQSASLCSATLDYIGCFLSQISFSVVSNARYPLEARLARWLLMCHDRIDGDVLDLTHEFMAIMVGAQRTGVTVTLHLLEGSGSIQSKRGRVIIRDRERLEELAGGAYGAPEAQYRRLIGDFGHAPILADAGG